jgi:hypothetical protein
LWLCQVSRLPFVPLQSYCDRHCPGRVPTCHSPSSFATKTQFGVQKHAYNPLFTLSAQSHLHNVTLVCHLMGPCLPRGPWVSVDLGHIPTSHDGIYTVLPTWQPSRTITPFSIPSLPFIPSHVFRVHGCALVLSSSAVCEHIYSIPSVVLSFTLQNLSPLDHAFLSRRYFSHPRARACPRRACQRQRKRFTEAASAQACHRRFSQVCASSQRRSGAGPSHRIQKP